MRKYFCDSCKKEQSSLNNVDVPCHLYSLPNSGYRDQEFNAISSRRDTIELCNKCLNKAYTALLKEINLWQR